MWGFLLAIGWIIVASLIIREVLAFFVSIIAGDKSAEDFRQWAGPLLIPAVIIICFLADWRVGCGALGGGVVGTLLCWIHWVRSR